MFRCLGATLLVEASVALTSVVQAAPDTKPHLRLVYHAPAACPNAAEFGRQVQALRPEVKSTARSTLDVRIELSVRGFVGTLRVPESSDSSFARELVSPDCAELAKALALVGAVLIDPSAQQRADSAASAEVVPRVAPKSDDSPPLSNVGASASSAPSGEPAPPRTPPQPVLVQRNNQNPWSILLATGLYVKSGVAPALTLGPSAAVGARGALVPEKVSIEGRASVMRTASGEVKKVLGDARLQWTSARADACAVFHLGPSGALTPCVVLELGELRADASRAVRATTRRALWLAPGGAIRSEVTLVGPLAAHIEGTATRPLIRPRFFFARAASGSSPETVYNVPLAALSGTVGVSVRIP